MPHAPSHVYRRPSGYYFCFNVPDRFRDIAGRRQNRHPLATRKLTVAKHRARVEAHANGFEAVARE
jgi:hypothetical protein